MHTDGNNQYYCCIINEFLVKIFQPSLCSSEYVSLRGKSSPMIEVWLGYDLKYGKYVVKSHNSDDGESSGAVPGHICWINIEIQVKNTQPWLCSSERERRRGKSDDKSAIRIWRNIISEIRCKITQPWWWSSMGGGNRDESDGADPDYVCWIISEIRGKLCCTDQDVT